MATPEASVFAREREVGTRPFAVVAHYVFQLDLVLLAVVAGLVGYGLWVIRSVTADDIPGDAAFFLSRQSLAAGLGFAVLLALASLNPDVLRRVRLPLYGVTIVLLVLVLLTEPIRESRRWIDLGIFNFQPSEFAKLALAIVVASMLASSGADGVGWRRVGVVLAVAAPAGLLVFVEPDFGTSLVLAVVVAAALFFAGAKWRIIVSIGALAVGVALAVLWLLPTNGITVLKPYQEDRLLGFLDPASDPSGSTYNVNQSITAVGAGGLTGRGTEEASQTTGFYLPEHATDFVFSSLAEQRGFLGAGLLLLLYGLLVWRGARIVGLAPNLFQMVLAGSIVSVFLFQIVLNVGMTMGIAPVVGIPLPFFSYGGSSMLASLAMIGVLLAIHARGRLSRQAASRFG
ncbi:MAG: rod shape-determining protein RodA [Gaiellaceae bacterium]